jgi:hypothetical protein
LEFSDLLDQYADVTTRRPRRGSIDNRRAKVRMKLHDLSITYNYYSEIVALDARSRVSDRKVFETAIAEGALRPSL